MTRSASRILLQTAGLEVQYETRRGIVRAVNELDLTLYEGERFGLVGESGSGKTTAILALLRLIEAPGRIAAGEIHMDGVDLLQLSEEEMRQVRLARIAMVPQGAMNSLNPVVRVGDQMRLTILEHERELNRDDADGRVVELLQMVGLSPSVARLYPHELSGGMKQRGVCRHRHLAPPAADPGRRTDECLGRGRPASDHADVALVAGAH